MTKARPKLPVRLLFAILIGLALMLNGMGQGAMAAVGDSGGRSVIIAGTVIALCQTSADESGKGTPTAVHDCDRCALSVSPALPMAAGFAVIGRTAYFVIQSRPVTTLRAPQRLDRLAWPRGPPIF